MRQHPIRIGPFKFVEFKPNEAIKVTRSLDYWKKDRPYRAAVAAGLPGAAQASVVGDRA
jgi:ABC-type transport system substrate-binding protein